MNIWLHLCEVVYGDEYLSTAYMDPFKAKVYYFYYFYYKCTFSKKMHNSKTVHSNDFQSQISTQMNMEGTLCINVLQKMVKNENECDTLTNFFMKMEYGIDSVEKRVSTSEQL